MITRSDDSDNSIGIIALVSYTSVLDKSARVFGTSVQASEYGQLGFWVQKAGHGLTQFHW